MRKTWTADELMSLAPAERQAIFDANSSPQVDNISEKMLDQARSHIRRHIAKTETVDPVDR